MKIKATNNFSGMVTLSTGEERDVRDDIAKDLIASGYAVALGKPKKDDPPADAPPADGPPKKKSK